MCGYILLNVPMFHILAAMAGGGAAGKESAGVNRGFHSAGEWPAEECSGSLREDCRRRDVDYPQVAMKRCAGKEFRWRRGVLTVDRREAEIKPMELRQRPAVVYKWERSRKEYAPRLDVRGTSD